MNVKQAYFDFLAKQGAKQKVKTAIENGISKWKNRPAYEYKSTINDFGDTSGEVNRIYGKTIGDICHTDVEVLLAYSGNSEATYCSGHGLDFGNVAKEISWDINNVFYDLRLKFMKENLQELIAEYDVQGYDDTWSDEDVWECLGEEMRSGERYDYIWMAEQFPEYLLDEEGNQTGKIYNLIFDITD